MKQYYIISNVNDRNAFAKSLANGEKFDVWFTSSVVRHYDEHGDLICTESATMDWDEVERIDPTTDTTMYVGFNFGSYVYLTVSIHEGLTIDECVCLRGQGDIDTYQTEAGEWVKCTADYTETIEKLSALRSRSDGAPEAGQEKEEHTMNTTTNTAARFWDYDSVRNFCIRHSYYTCGTCCEYVELLTFADKMEPTELNLLAAARNIFDHSDTSKTPEEIAAELDAEAVSTISHEDLDDAMTAEVEQQSSALATIESIQNTISETKTRSAWSRGVKAYAFELLEELAEAVEGGWIDADDLSNRRLFENAMLDGASSWREYSEGGCSLIHDCSIAERLCTPSELRKTDGGRKDPNPSESWIDVQSRALYQAADMILRVAF